MRIFFIYYSEAEKGPRSFVRVSSSKGETGLAEKSQSEISSQDGCWLNNIIEKESRSVLER